MASAGQMHRSGVNKESAIVFNYGFGRQKSGKIEQISAQFGRFQTPRFRIYHVRIRHEFAVGGVSGFFTQGGLLESAVVGRVRAGPERSTPPRTCNPETRDINRAPARCGSCRTMQPDFLSFRNVSVQMHTFNCPARWIVHLRKLLGPAERFRRRTCNRRTEGDRQARGGIFEHAIEDCSIQISFLRSWRLPWKALRGVRQHPV